MSTSFLSPPLFFSVLGFNLGPGYAMWSPLHLLPSVCLIALSTDVYSICPKLYNTLSKPTLKIFVISRWWWCTPWIPALRNQRLWISWVWGRPDLQSEFQYNQNYTKKQNQNKEKCTMCHLFIYLSCTLLCDHYQPPSTFKLLLSFGILSLS